MAATASVKHTRIKNLALFVDDTTNSGNFLLLPAASDCTINNVDLVGTWPAAPADSITAGVERYQYLCVWSLLSGCPVTVLRCPSLRQPKNFYEK